MDLFVRNWLKVAKSGLGILDWGFWIGDFGLCGCLVFVNLLVV